MEVISIFFSLYLWGILMSSLDRGSCSNSIRAHTEAGEWQKRESAEIGLFPFFFFQPSFHTASALSHPAPPTFPISFVQGQACPQNGTDDAFYVNT